MTNEQLRMQMLAGVITEGEYTAIINKQIEEADKESLNESMIGGIVGIGAITQIPATPKTDYEMAFEHFLGERYENREQDLKEEDTVEDMEERTAAEVEEGIENNIMRAYKIAEDIIRHDINFPDDALSNEDLFLDVIKALKDLLYEKASDLFATTAGSSPDEYSMEEGKEVEEPENY